MTILVTGSTGTIGSLVVAYLVRKGADIHALTRAPEKSRFPGGVTPVKGDLADVGAMRAVLAKVSTLFLLNAVTPDELTQAIITLNLAREAGIQRIVYFSVLHSDKYTNVPHFAGKYAVERMIEQFELPAAILRPAYFMQNDARLKNEVLGAQCLSDANRRRGAFNGGRARYRGSCGVAASPERASCKLPSAGSD